MRNLLTLTMFVLVIAFVHAAEAYADTPAGGTEWDESISFQDDSAPIVNCKTARQDITLYEKQIAEIEQNLLKEAMGVIPASDYDGDGIIDPEKDVEAGRAQQKGFQAKIDNIKNVCGL